MTSVKTAAHGSFDRVTFAFEPSMSGSAGTPAFEVSQVQRPFTKDPSDQPMSVDGDRFFRIVFHGASGVDLSEGDPRRTYKGSEDIHTGLTRIVEVEEQGDFEATLSWIIGIRGPGCPTSISLTGPVRVGLDFAS
ncbi:MAG: hypothetical protein LC723_05490 [Actinobacteria bacterium]|nr:hypothetical protein [Actinomycetota bacterium]